MTRLDQVLGLLDRALQVLVPPLPRRVAYISFPDYTDNAFYVFRHALRTRHDLEHVWLVTDAALRDRIAREFAETVRAAGTHGHVLRVVSRASLAGYFAGLRAGCVFHTHGAYRFRQWAWRRHSVCLWHGMPIKCVGRLNRITPNPSPTFGTRHIATSAFFRPIIAAAFGVDESAVTVCSLPRCDALQIDGAAALPGPEVRQRLGVPRDRRLVVWLPTYRAEQDPATGAVARSFLDDLPPDTLAGLDAAAARTGCFVLAKLHPLDPLNRSAPSWPARHVRLLTAAQWSEHQLQLYDLLAASAALISDVSSVLIDYLVAGRPVGILGFDPATYTRELTFPIERLLDSGRFDVLTPATLEAFLGRAGQRETGARASFLYETFALPGAEQVLRDVGL